MSDSINRRQLLVLGAVTAAGVCLGDAAGLLAQQALGPIDVGTLAEFAADGVYDKFAKSGGVIVVRSDGKIWAMRSRCTHKKGIVKANGDAIECPSHHSRFDLQGNPTKGPAKEPLARLSISVNADGKITVDPGKTVSPDAADATIVGG